MDKPITQKEFKKHLEKCSLEELEGIVLKIDPKFFPKRYQLANEKLSVLRNKNRIISKEEKTDKIRIQYIIGGLLAVLGASRAGAYEHTPNFGWFLIVGGLFVIIFYAFRKIDINKIEEARPKHSICPNCGEIYRGSPDAIECNRCKIELEPIEGLFDRQPDFTSNLRNKDT